MPVKCVHGIKLLNLHNNAVITHQILLVKGVVDNLKCSNEQDIVLSVENLEILATGLSTQTGRFKFLINLGKENKKHELKFVYCNAKLLINITYQRKESFYRIQPLLITTDEEQEHSEKVKSNLEIIDLNLLLIQLVYAEKLSEVAEKRLTFVLNDKCKIFRSKLKCEAIFHLNEQDLWQTCAKEILESDWGKQEQLKFVAFINCSKYLGDAVQKSQDFSYQNIRKHIKGHAALGAGGLALFSTTYFYSWPSQFKNILNCFQNQQELNLAIEPDDSNYRKTRAGVYASSLGAVCHEIGHIFDLGHDMEGVMGSNFDYINKVFLLQTKTEHLPPRIVQEKSPNQLQAKPRFTRFKEPANGFLLRYREQQENDSFYFTANSAIILSHHAWLRNDIEAFRSETFNVQLHKDLGIVKSIKLPLKIIEIRECANSLVKEWFDLQKLSMQQQVFEFNFASIKFSLTSDYYIFVMSVHGHTKKLEI